MTSKYGSYSPKVFGKFVLSKSDFGYFKTKKSGRNTKITFFCGCRGQKITAENRVKAWNRDVQVEFKIW